MDQSLLGAVTGAFPRRTGPHDQRVDQVHLANLVGQLGREPVPPDTRMFDPEAARGDQPGQDLRSTRLRLGYSLLAL